MPHLKYRLIAISLLCLTAGLTGSESRPAFAQSDDEAAIRSLVGKFYAAYQKEDIEALMSLWSERSADVSAKRERLQNTFNDFQRIEVKALDIRNVTLEADKAKVQLTVEVSALNAKNGRPADGFGKMSRVIQVAREAAGWKIWRYFSDEEEFSAELAKAKTDSERQALLNEKSAFVTVDLLRPLLQEANRLQDQGRSADALGLYQILLSVAEQHGEKAFSVTALRVTGNVYVTQGNYPQALSYYEKSLRLSEEIGNKQDIARISVNIGIVHSMQGNNAQALIYYQKFLKLAEELENKEMIATAFNSIANVYKAQGDYSEALESYLKSLKLAEELGHPYLISVSLNNIGLIYHSQNNLIQALEYYGKSLKLAEEMGNKRGIEMSLMNIGGVHYRQGNFSQALEYYGKSLKLAEELGSKDSIARVFGNIGLVHKLQGNFAQALEYNQKALKLGEELGSKELIAGSLNNIGDVYSSQKRFEEALPYFERSLAIAQEMGSAEYIAQSLTNIGEVNFMLNRPKLAIEYGRRAADLALQAGLLSLLWPARTTEGKAHRLLNHPDLARQSFLDAISTIEKMRGQVAGGEQAQQLFFQDKVFPYHAMVDLLVSEKEFAKALNYAERAKGRVLLDVLSSGRVNITKAMTGLELSEDRALLSEITVLNAQLLELKLQRSSNQTEIAKLTARLEKARISYESFQANLYTAHPELKVQRGETRALTLDEADELLPDDKTALLEYVVTDERTHLFVITRIAGPGRKREQSPILRVYSLDIKSKELAGLAEEFRLRVAERNLAIKKTAQQIYDLLIRPVEHQLKGITKLCIIPDGPLWNLPFQALYQGERGYLLEQYAVFYAPSLSVLREMVSKSKRSQALAWRLEIRRNQRGQAIGRQHSLEPRLLALGNPALGNEAVAMSGFERDDEGLSPLPNAEREVISLGRLYGPSRSKILVADQALERTVKSEAGKYSDLHFAAHAILDDRHPMYSRIVLSRAAGDVEEDGLLEAWEILKLDLTADLVVLSACQTARGRVGAGEGMIGMAWALFVAGCPSVVVSQWKVDSARTTDLMLEFHRNLLRRKSGNTPAMTKAEALRAAALKLLHGPHKHPAYWAGFVLIGNER